MIMAETVLRKAVSGNCRRYEIVQEKPRMNKSGRDAGFYREDHRDGFMK